MTDFTGNLDHSTLIMGHESKELAERAERLAVAIQPRLSIVIVNVS